MSDQFSWGVIFRIKNHVVSWSPLTDRWTVFDGVVFEVEKDTRKEAVLYVMEKEGIEEKDLVLKYDELASPPVDTKSRIKVSPGSSGEEGGEMETPLPSMSSGAGETPALGGNEKNDSPPLDKGPDFSSLNL